MNDYLYHGTSRQSASTILEQGFDLSRQLWGRGWGNGVYLSLSEEFAGTWGHTIVVCQLQKGTRLLWHDAYDQGVIKYLKKEFGAAIAKPDFWKELPSNKQLTKSELVNLWRFLTKKFYQNPGRFKKGGYQKLANNYSRIYQQLRYHGFQGVGSKDPQWPEVMIFNPSLVLPQHIMKADS